MKTISFDLLTLIYIDESSWTISSCQFDWFAVEWFVQKLADSHISWQPDVIVFIYWRWARALWSSWRLQDFPEKVQRGRLFRCAFSSYVYAFSVKSTTSFIQQLAYSESLPVVASLTWNFIPQIQQVGRFLIECCLIFVTIIIPVHFNFSCFF